jgi:hypothetical protein
VGPRLVQPKAKGEESECQAQKSEVVEEELKVTEQFCNFSSEVAHLHLHASHGL